KITNFEQKEDSHLTCSCCLPFVYFSASIKIFSCSIHHTGASLLMVWVIELYQPILDNGYHKWLQANSMERPARIERTAMKVQKAYNEAVQKEKVLPSLPKDLPKVCLLFIQCKELLNQFIGCFQLVQKYSCKSCWL